VAIGRCSGCGLSHKDSALVREHTRYCRKYAALYARDPGLVLEPEAEFIRWRDDDRGKEREEHRGEVIAEADRRRAVQADRWATPPDILEE
jgi:hypothetical protein